MLSVTRIRPSSVYRQSVATLDIDIPCRTIYNRVPLWWFTGNGCMCLYHKWVRVRVFVFLYHDWHMRGFWRDNVWIWHVSGRAHCVLQFRLPNESLNERNTLPSTVTYSEIDLSQHAVRQLKIHMCPTIQFRKDGSISDTQCCCQDRCVVDHDKRQGAALLYLKHMS